MFITAVLQFCAMKADHVDPTANELEYIERWTSLARKVDDLLPELAGAAIVDDPKSTTTQLEIKELLSKITSMHAFLTDLREQHNALSHSFPEYYSPKTMVEEQRKAQHQRIKDYIHGLIVALRVDFNRHPDLQLIMLDINRISGH